MLEITLLPPPPPPPFFSQFPELKERHHQFKKTHQSALLLIM